MRVNVTQGMIDSGLREDCTACPIALALRELGYHDIDVNGDSISVGDIDFPVPREAYKFMLEFDSGNTVYPFSFDLDIDGAA